jgi:hypothetical protein
MSSLVGMENSQVEFVQKNFICLISNVVVGRITNINITGNDMIVMFPKWEKLLNVLESQTPSFVPYDKFVPDGSVWDGTQFILPEIADENAL